MGYKLVAADTVEDKIIELQERKRQLFRATVDADRLEVDALSREDLEAVFADPGALALDAEAEDDEDEYDPVESIAYAEPPRRSAEFVPFTPRPTAATAAAEDAGPARVLELFPRRDDRS